MKLILSVIAVLSAMILTSLSFATLTTPTAKNVGANMATLTLQSSGDGTGFFTLRPGSDAYCGTGPKVAFGSFSTHHGSLPLFANVSASYTVRNLKENTAYTACFTADSNLDEEPVTANISTAPALAITRPGWGMAGAAGFSAGTAHFTSLAVSPDGTPYLAYVDTNDDNRITVMKYSEGSWVLAGEGGFAAGSANPASLAFAPDGAPHVGFVDDATGSASVMRYDGSGWGSIGSSGFSADTMATSLAFAPDGSPYLAFIDASTSLVRVIRYGGSAWAGVGGAGFSAGGADYLSLAFSPDGVPYVAYSDQGSYSNGKTTVMKYDGGSWVSVGSAGFSAGTASFVSLAIDSDGTPHVAYQDASNGYKATVMKYDGTAWSLVGSGGASAGGAGFTSLAIAPDGLPYLAFQDWGSSYKATVMKYDGTDWDAVGNAGFSAGTANSTALALAPDGSPYVAYGDEGNGSKTTVMKLGNKPTISGTPAATVTVGTGYSFTPEAFDATGFTIQNMPPWASFAAATGELSGTPDSAGSYSNIVISASNSYGSASLPPFSITVSSSGTSDSVKLVSNGTTYPTIASALSAATGSDTLKILTTIAPESVAYEGDGTITLEGGNDENWEQQPGQFTNVGSISITSGTLVMDQIAVQ